MSSGLYLPHVRDLYVRPALDALPAALNGFSAVQGVLGIGNKESGYRYVKQLGAGPALGFWQMEPATHDDLWKNFIQFRPALQQALKALLAGAEPAPGRLVTHTLYAAAMCRVHLYRAPAIIPAAGNAVGWAGFWKTYYNTGKGAGDAAEAVPYFLEAMKA